MLAGRNPPVHLALATASLKGLSSSSPRLTRFLCQVTMDVAPLTMAAIFVNFDAGHRYEEGGDYYACYLKMLNIMCVGFAPSCQYRDQQFISASVIFLRPCNFN